MTVTDEMREAGAALIRDCKIWMVDVEEIYLSMRALDPEITALRNDELNGRTYRAAVDYYDPLLHDCEAELAALRPVVEAADAWVKMIEGAEKFECQEELQLLVHDTEGGLIVAVRAWREAAEAKGEKS
jgi:hypothetical protein